MLYRGPLDHDPVLKKEPYSYASWNKVCYLRAFKNFLEREATGEFGMTYEGRSDDGKLHRFKLPSTHKGRDYYHGASGSPIVDIEGKAASLLLGGDPGTNLLCGLPIKDYLHLLDIELDSST